eukprot:gene10948-biopygen15372
MPRNWTPPIPTTPSLPRNSQRARLYRTWLHCMRTRQSHPRWSACLVTHNTHPTTADPAAVVARLCRIWLSTYIARRRPSHSP